uniref:SWIM-type domain-containing protein n=1 Tax=Brassica oleracea var. oleracea TaxID=109376 RepID=A0A0D3BT92_BRAOL
MSSEEGRLITFGCYYGGKFEEVDGKDLYNGGGYRIMEAYPSRLFPELMNQLPISLYGQRVWFKFPYEGIEERQLIRNGDDQFTKMCRASVWVDSIDIFVEPETEGDESRAENEREETERYEADSEAERYEAERNEHQFDEEARVERNVADFVDEDFDEYATPLCSDDDEDGVERDGYLRYIKGSGDLKLRQAFESLEAFKKAMVDYVLKHRWNIKYVRWEKDKSELKCASEAEEGEEQCMWKIYCSYEEPLQKWLVKVLMKEHTCMRSGRSSLLTQEVIAGLQKGLLNAVEDLLPRVEHRMCARHIYGNLKKVHPNRADMKGLFWKVAKSYNTAQYNKRVDHVKAYDMDVYNSMMMKNPKNCSLAYFSSTSSCDDVSNNISESFNHAIDPARYMPFVEMLETIRRKAMLRIEARKLISMKHKGKFSIKAVERVELEQTKIRLCNIYHCGHEIFEVKEKNFSYKVKMLEHSCTCRKWDMSGLPCRHALKVIVEKKRKKEDYIGDCYLTSKWRMQYQTPIEAVHGVNFWKKVRGGFGLIQ